MPGEILSFRRELFEAPLGDVINDDNYLTLLVLRKGYRVAYQPQAKSFEPISPFARDEFERRARFVAGRYQAMMMWPLDLVWRRPLVTLQWVSHKFLRLVLPFAMFGALAANLLIAVWPPEPSTVLGWAGLSPPYGGILLALQAFFYLLAWAGSRVKKRGVLGKLLYLPSYLVTSNLATLAGFFRYLTGRQTPTWQRAARSRS
jgi:hypothetical protein